MKKRLNKKLVLNKMTISSLKDKDMHLIRGATLVFDCTESCSLVWICCTPTKEYAMDQDIGKNQG